MLYNTVIILISKKGFVKRATRNSCIKTTIQHHSVLFLSACPYACKPSFSTLQIPGYFISAIFLDLHQNNPYTRFLYKIIKCCDQCGDYTNQRSYFRNSNPKLWKRTDSIYEYGIAQNILVLHLPLIKSVYHSITDCYNIN